MPTNPSRRSPTPRGLALTALLALVAGCVGAGVIDEPTPTPTPESPVDDDDAADDDDTTEPETPAPLGPRVRLSEIHYHPVLEESYEDEHEFIELHNAGDAPAPLQGWAFDEGIDYTFGDVTLEPGQTLVLAANRQALLDAWALDPTLVLGDYDGQLANGGERLRLLDAGGEVVEELRYDDEAPWPLGADALGASRRWLPADVGSLEDHRHAGRSLQRVSFDAPANDPGNWEASPLDGVDPTITSTGDREAALPLVVALSWAGATPDELPPDAPVLLEADVAGGPIDGLRVEWFVDDLEATGEVTETVAMVDDGTGADRFAGDGRYSAELPGQPDGTVLRVRLLGDDGEGDRVVSPRAGDPGPWHARYVGLPIPGSTRAYRILIAPDEWTAMWDAADPGRVIDECTPNPGWEERSPAVFVYGGQVFDVFVRYQGSRWNRTNGRTVSAWGPGGPERPDPMKILSWSVKFSRHAPFQGRQAFTLNKLTQGCPGLTAGVGFGLFADAGLPTPAVRYARLYVNGAYYNYTLEIERPAGDMLDRWLAERADADPTLPEEPGTPHLFKSGGCNCDEGPYGWGDERPLGSHCGYSALERYAWTYERKTWSWAGHQELADLIVGLDSARAFPDEDLRAFLDAHFDVDGVLSYMAVMNWGVPFDDMFQNHFLVQRRSDGRWFLAPWDLDLDFGGWKGPNASIYMGEQGDPDNRSGWWNRIKDSFLRVYRDEYDARLFELNETVLHPSAVSGRVDAMEASWNLTEFSSTPAGPDCNATARADAFRQFAQDRHDVVAGIAASREP